MQVKAQWHKLMKSFGRMTQVHVLEHQLVKLDNCMEVALAWGRRCAGPLLGLQIYQSLTKFTQQNVWHFRTFDNPSTCELKIAWPKLPKCPGQCWESKIALPTLLPEWESLRHWFTFTCTATTTTNAETQVDAFDFNQHGSRRRFCESLYGYIIQQQAALFDDFMKVIVELRKALEDRDSWIKTLEAEVEKLSATADHQEQYSRRNSLRISGLPESDTEDVVEESLKLFNNIMRVSPPMDLSEVDRSHRMGPKTGGRPRQILIKFATYRSRQCVYRERAVLKPGRRSVRPWVRQPLCIRLMPPRNQWCQLYISTRILQRWEQIFYIGHERYPRLLEFGWTGIDSYDGEKCHSN